MRAVRVVQGDTPYNSRLSINETDMPELRYGEVLVKVKATAVNRADLLQRRGEYDPPKGESTIMGLEAVGHVVDANLQPVDGKLVGCLLPGGGYGEYVAV